LDLLLDDYYDSRGWTLEGVPTLGKLNELGMDDLSDIVEGKQES
jgi:aldehyde:ferredoxin oxidoreductase